MGEVAVVDKNMTLALSFGSVIMIHLSVQEQTEMILNQLIARECCLVGSSLHQSINPTVHL